MKFHTHHFPAGTIVVLEDDMYRHTPSKIPGEEFEITKVVRTGPVNYVLETTKKMDREAFGDMNQAFNMTCVKAIVKRGSGPVVFHERDFDPKDFRFLEEKHELAAYMNVKIKKTHFAHWSLRDILMFCIINRPVNGSMLDMETLQAAVEKQSFVHSLNDYGSVSVNKKRLKRFIKQNYNRFLVKVKKTQDEQDKMYAEMDERAFNAAFEDDFDEVGSLSIKELSTSFHKLFHEDNMENTMVDAMNDINFIEAAKVVDDPGFIPETGRVTMAEISVKHLETEQVKKHEEDM